MINAGLIHGTVLPDMGKHAYRHTPIDAKRDGFSLEQQAEPASVTDGREARAKALHAPWTDAALVAQDKVDAAVLPRLGARIRAKFFLKRSPDGLRRVA